MHTGGEENRTHFRAVHPNMKHGGISVKTSTSKKKTPSPRRGKMERNVIRSEEEEVRSKQRRQQTTP